MSMRPQSLETVGSAPPAIAHAPEGRVLSMPRGRFRRRADATVGGADGLADESPSSRAGPRGWRRSSQCLWCAIGVQRPDLLDDLHRLHVVNELGARALHQLAKKRLEARGDRTPSSRGLGRHLSGHLRRAYYQVGGRAESVESEASFTPTKSRTVQPRELGELWRLYHRLDRKLKQLDGTLELIEEAGYTDLNRIAQLTGLSNSARQTLETIAKVRSEPTTSAAIAQTGVRHALTRYASVVSDLIRELANEADASGSPEMALRIRGIGPELAEAVGTVFREAVEHTLSDFEIERTASVG